MLSVGDVCGRVLKDDELGRHADMILLVAGEICGATAAVAVVAALFAGGQGISLKMDVQGSVGMLLFVPVFRRCCCWLSVDGACGPMIAVPVLTLDAPTLLRVDRSRG